MEKKKYYKDGDPDLFNYFSDDEVKNWKEREKAMWHPYSDVEQAPIPQEVIEFQQAQAGKVQQELKAKEAEIAKLKAKLEAKEALSQDDKPKDEEPKDEKLTEDQEKKVVMEELRQKGIRFAPNSKLSTLKKKLEDAND